MVNMSQAPNNLTYDITGNTTGIEAAVARSQALAKATNDKLIADEQRKNAAIAADAQRLADIQTRTEQTKLIAAGKNHEAETLGITAKFDKEIAAAQTAAERGALINLKAVSLKAMAEEQATKVHAAELDKQTTATQQAAAKQQAAQEKTFTESFKGLEKVGKIAALVGAAGAAIEIGKNVGKLAFGGGDSDSVEKIADDYTKAKDSLLSFTGAVPIVGGALTKLTTVVIDLGEAMMGSPMDALKKREEQMRALALSTDLAAESAARLKGITDAIQKPAEKARAETKLLETPEGGQRDRAALAQQLDDEVKAAEKAAEDAADRVKRAGAKQQEALDAGKAKLDAISEAKGRSLNSFVTNADAVGGGNVSQEELARRKASFVSNLESGSRDEIKNAEAAAAALANEKKQLAESGQAIEATKKLREAKLADFDKQQAAKNLATIEANSEEERAARAAAIQASSKSDIEKVNAAADERVRAIEAGAKKEKEAAVKDAGGDVAKKIELQAELKVASDPDAKKKITDQIAAIEAGQKAVDSIEGKRGAQVDASNAQRDAAVDAITEAAQAKAAAITDANDAEIDAAVKHGEELRAAVEKLRDDAEVDALRGDGKILAARLTEIDKSYAKQIEAAEDGEVKLRLAAERGRKKADEVRSFGGTDADTVKDAKFKTRQIELTSTGKDRDADTAKREQIVADFDRQIEELSKKEVEITARLEVEIDPEAKKKLEEQLGNLDALKIEAKKQEDAKLAAVKPKAEPVAQFIGLTDLYKQIAQRTAGSDPVVAATEKVVEAAKETTAAVKENTAAVKAEKKPAPAIGN